MYQRGLTVLEPDIVNYKLPRNQFDFCSSKIFLQPISVPVVTISQTYAIRNAFLGIDTSSCCRCSHCKSNRCPCRKSSQSCGDKYGSEMFQLKLFNSYAVL